ncbi:MAG: glycosyltransferase family 39 protein [Phycisphaerales bacterium]|nr:glycosyltransferase family 39 protein [Phycisphaerales bacterium]
MNPRAAHVDRYGLIYALLIYVVSRAIVMTAALLAPLHTANREPGLFWVDPPTIRWDAGHYRYILMFGYPPQPSDTTAFFPAYPLVTWPLAKLTGRPDLSLVIVSHVCGAGAIAFFYLWARRRADADLALRAVALVCSYPPAMFFSTGYSEGLFLLCVAAALYFLEREWFWRAALTSALATGTRPTGIVIAAIVMLYFLTSHRAIAWPRRLTRAAALGFASLAGILAHEAFLWRYYGRADAYFAAQESWKPKERPDYWRRVVTLKPVLQPALEPIKGLARADFAALKNPATWNQFWNVSLLTIAICGLVGPGRWPRVPFLIPILMFLMGYLADPAGGARLVGIARYQLAALPCFAWLAGVRGLRGGLIPIGLLCAALMLLQVRYVQLFCDWVLVS